MSFLTLLLNLGLALAKVFGFAQDNIRRENDQEIGAALQRERDLTDEAKRVAAAARAGIERLPDNASQPDPYDRDGRS